MMDGQWDLSREASPSLRMLCAVAAALTLLYHAESALAQSAYGIVVDDEATVVWEYDLEQGFGEILVCPSHLDPDLDGYRRYFRGLIPEFAEDIEFDEPDDSSLYQCSHYEQICSSGPLSRLAATVPNFCNSVVFSLPQPQYKELRYSALVHGLVCDEPDGVCMSASPCVEPPIGCFDNFVTIAPIPGNDDADFDNDGDVDILDFARFQDLFTGSDD